MTKFKKLSIITVLLFTFCFSTAAFAAVPQVSEESQIIYFANGDYLKITTIIGTRAARALEQSAEKQYNYYSNNKIAVRYTLTGFFEYDGKTCRATDASGDVVIYQSGWSLSDHEESYSGNTVRGTAVFSGPSGDKTIRGSITCDKNGNIS